MYFEDRIRDETPEVQRCAMAYAHLQGWSRRDELHDILEIARRDARIFDLEREVAALQADIDEMRRLVECYEMSYRDR